MRDTAINEKQINELLAAWFQKTDGRRCGAEFDECDQRWWHLKLGTTPVGMPLFTRSLDMMEQLERVMTNDQKDEYAKTLAGDGRDILCCTFSTAFDRAYAACRAIGAVCDHEEVTDECSQCAYEREMDERADKAAL